MTHLEIRKKFLHFFSAKGGPASGGQHTIVPSSSLLPTDPSVLFTTAGMQQFKPYYTGQADPMRDFSSLNTTSIQKAMRTSDIDEVGDVSHLTFFEMLGNFSFGGYFKKDAIKFAHEFITKEMKLKIDYVTIFAGEVNVPEDTESEQIWKSIDSKLKVKKFGRADNFWGPTGVEGPCGPTTEIYVKGVEVWNIVFNQYYQNKDGSLELLKTPGIDTGMGLERLAMMAQDVTTVFETDLLYPIMSLLTNGFDERIKRIITDHCRAMTFLIADGVRPSNKDRGYILRRIMRRVLVHEHRAHGTFEIEAIVREVVKLYRDSYPNLIKSEIVPIVEEEKKKFSQTLKAGLRELERIEAIDAKAAFRLYESYGLPYEIIKELGEEDAAELTREAFDEEFKKHQDKSREGSVKKFGGHGLILDTGELKAANNEELKRVTRLHTATHMLQAALRKVLGDEVHQAGSDITAERLRFDFTFSRKLTLDEMAEVEHLMNDTIRRDLPVSYEELPIEEAKKTGALYFFKEKYPERVKVYSVGNPAVAGQVFSKEFCGGPHVSHTVEIGRFKIAKEEAVSAGVRRIRATVE